MTNKENDIRMYVERLFLGRELTSDLIELKEEVYSNLQARYQDYLAEGLDPEEAYAKTCEAVTSIDDVLGEEDAEADANAAVSESEPEPEPVAAPEPTPNTRLAKLRNPASWSKGTRIAVAAACALLLVLFGVRIGCVSSTVSETTSEAQNTSYTLTTDDDGAALYPTGTDPVAVSDDATTTTLTKNEATHILFTEIADQTATDLTKTYSKLISESDSITGQVKGLLEALPYADKITSNVATYDEETDSVLLTATYLVEDADFDGVGEDVMEQALVYNAATLMAFNDGLDTVEFVVIENEVDGEVDKDVRRFERIRLENELGYPLSIMHTTDNDLWEIFKSNVCAEKFYDRMWDFADVD